MPNKMAVSDVVRFLLGKGAKKEEVVWTNITEFLEDAAAQGKKSVTKEEVLDHLKNNRIVVNEVTAGDTPAHVLRAERVADKSFKKVESLIEKLQRGWRQEHGIAVNRALAHQVKVDPDRLYVDTDHHIGAPLSAAYRTITNTRGLDAADYEFFAGEVGKIHDMFPVHLIAGFKDIDSAELIARVAKLRDRIRDVSVSVPKDGVLSSRLSKLDVELRKIQPHLVRREQIDALAETPAWKQWLADKKKAAEIAAADGIEPPRYGRWTLEGGSNYREVKITLQSKTQKILADPDVQELMRRHQATDLMSPGPRRDAYNAARDKVYAKYGVPADVSPGTWAEKLREGAFTHYHWPGESNVLVHFRAKNRVDDQGRKVFFVEEIQSDWHQLGRKHGYKDQKIKIPDAVELSLQKLESTKKAVNDWKAANPRPPNYQRGLEVKEESGLDVFGFMYWQRVDAWKKTLSKEDLDAYESMWSWQKKAYGEMRGSDGELNQVVDAYHDAVRGAVEATDQMGMRFHASGGNIRRDMDQSIVPIERLRDDVTEILRSRRSSDAVPDAPFKDTKAWAALAVKRIMRMAADEGFDGVAFIRGEDAAAVVGMPDEAAEAFYDVVLPSVVKKHTKAPLGKTKISIREIEGGEDYEYLRRRGMEGVQDLGGQEFNFVELTPAVKAKVGGPQVLFQRTAPKQTGWEMKELADGLVELTSAEIRAARAAGAAPAAKLPETPEEIKAAFKQMGRIQRAGPESQMVQVRYRDGDQLAPIAQLVENVGDLIHRMGDLATGSVRGKLEKTYDYIRTPDETGNFVRGLKTAKDDATYHKMLIDQGYRRHVALAKAAPERHKLKAREKFVRDLEEQMDLYAQEHRTIPVYNEVQRLANDVAIAVGERRYVDASDALGKLQKYVDEGDDAFRARMERVEPEFARPGSTADVSAPAARAAGVAPAVKIVTSQKVLDKVWLQTDGQPNLRRLNEKIKGESKYYEQTLVPLDDIKPMDDMADVDFRRADELKGPIVIGRDGVIIDGHHRYALALNRGDKSIEVYRPIEDHRLDQLLRDRAAGAKPAAAIDIPTDTSAYEGQQKVGKVLFDSKDGMGAVSDNRNVAYRGFVVWMKPKDFIGLNPARPTESAAKTIEATKKAIDSGKPIGPPFLEVKLVKEGDNAGSFQVVQHEGRGRMAAINEIDPDTPVPVHVFGRGVIDRGKDITPDMMQDLVDPGSKVRLLPDKKVVEGKEVTPEAAWHVPDSDDYDPNYLPVGKTYRGTEAAPAKPAATKGDVDSFFADYMAATQPDIMGDDRIRSWFMTTDLKFAPKGLKPLETAERYHYSGKMSLTPGLDMDDGDIYLDLISVPEKARGYGISSQILEYVNDLANKHGVSISLVPDVPERMTGRLSNKELADWYKRYGYETLLDAEGKAVKINGVDKLIRYPAKPPAAPAEEVMGAGLVFKVEDNVLRVQSVELPEAMRGKGVGTEMYMRALRHAKEKGFGFSSDVAPSPDAIAAYERMIEQGIPLTRKTVEAADGKMVQQFVMEADELRRVDLDAAKPTSDPRILYQEAPRKSAVQVKAELDRARLVPDKVILGVLGGERPEHLDGVIDFLTAQRQRVRAGEMTRRDVVKAWVMTVMSMQSGAIDATKLAQKLASQGLDIPLGADFIAPLRSGKPGIRPEEAAAAWLFSPDGQKFLDAMDGGAFDADAYKSLVAMREAFGNATPTRNLGLPGKQMTLVDIGKIDALVSAINAAGKSGDTDAMSKAVRSMQGIGPGKDGFIKHLLGFGDSPTIDAVEINLWLTGRGDIGALKTKSAQLARDVKDRLSSRAVSETIKRRITQRLKGLQKSGITEGVDDDIAPHILHHWLWDRAKDLETTHKGLYKAQVLAQEIDDELRGAMEFLENGRSVIYGLNKPNFATFIHEIGHVMRRDLSEVQMDTVVKWLNDTEGVSVSAKGGRFAGTAEMVTEAEEKFARAFEEYIRTGVAAKPSLKQVFEQMKQWLIGIYGSLSGLDVTVTPDIRKVFDELLGNEPAKQPFLRNIMKTVRDEITGDSLRNKGTRYNLFKDLARESRRLGHDISHVDLVKQFDESAAADAAARGVAKKDGLGKITLPGPVYMAGRFPEGKAEFAAADLVRLTEEVIGASLLAKAPGPRMALSARREAIKEMTPTQIIDNWVSSGEFAGVKKWVRSIFLGGDAVEDMRNLPEPIRRSIIAMPKELEQTVGDVIKLITTGDFDSTVAYITGDLVNFADSGRPAISSGHDMMGSVLMQMKRFFDPAQGPLTSAELNALIDFAESIHVHKGTLEYTQMRAKAELVTSALAKIKSDSAASPFISEVLKAAGVAPGRQLLPNIFGAPSKAGQPGSLIESLMYASGVSRRPPAGLGRATKQFDLQFLPAAQRMDSAHIFTQLYSDLVSPSLFKGDPKVANRVVVLIAGHGKAAKAMSTWAKMGIVTDAQTASAFKRWVSGEVVESEVDMLRVLQLYQVHGYSPNFVKGMDLYGLDLYVPKAARRRLSQALIRATDPSVSDLLKGDFLEAIGGGTAVTTDPLAMGLAWSYRYSKTRMVRGHFVMKSRYFTMNTFDHYNQMALVTGFRPAFVSTIRMMDQNAISNPLGQAVVVAAKKLGFPKAGEAIRKQLQKAGDKGAHWAGAILMGSKWRLEVNDILEGRRIVYSLGGNPTSAKVIRDIALQEGIFSSFDTAQLGTKIQKSLDLLLKQAKENDPDMALRLKRFLSLNDFPRVAADIAEAWSERERLGAMVTLMEMGIDARTAARITIDALYDYAGSMSKWDRHWLINLVLPFWAFQKNANRQIMDTVFSPKGAYRLGVMRRSYEHGLDLLSDMLYYDMVDEYGIDTENMSIELSDTYYGLKEALEEHYGSADAIPDDVRRDFETWVSGKMRAGALESSALFTGDKIKRLLMATGTLELSRYYVPKPAMSSRRTFRRDRPGLAVPHTYRENMRKWINGIRNNTPDTPYTFVMLPEPFYTAAFHHMGYTAATMILAAEGLVKAPLSLVTEGDSTDDLVQSMGVLGEVFSPQRAPVPSELLASYGLEKASYPQKLHPSLVAIAEASGIDTFATTPSEDPFTKEAERKDALEQGRPVAEFAGTIKEMRYYMMPGIPRLLFVNNPIGELNSILMKSRVTPLEQAAAKGESILWARRITGLDTEDVFQERTVAGELRRARNEKGSEKVYDAARKGRKKRPSDK